MKCIGVHKPYMTCWKDNLVNQCLSEGKGGHRAATSYLLHVYNLGSYKIYRCLVFMNKYTLQTFYLHACVSVLGFQSGSKMTTRSAPVRLTPSPPTRVVKMNKKMSSLKESFFS